MRPPPPPRPSPRTSPPPQYRRPPRAAPRLPPPPRSRAKFLPGLVPRFRTRQQVAQGLASEGEQQPQARKSLSRSTAALQAAHACGGAGRDVAAGRRGSGSPSPPGPPGGIRHQAPAHVLELWSAARRRRLEVEGRDDHEPEPVGRGERRGRGRGGAEASVDVGGGLGDGLPRRRNSDSKNEDEEMSTHAPMGHKESPIAPIGPEFGPRWTGG